MAEETPDIDPTKAVSEKQILELCVTLKDPKRIIIDDPYWTSTKNSLERIELSSINKVSLV